MSTIVNRRTREVPSTRPDRIQSDALCDTSQLNETVLNTLRVPVVHCFRNRRTRDITSVNTKNHKSSRGYASTRRVKHSTEAVRRFIRNLYKKSHLLREENGFEFHHHFQRNSILARDVTAAPSPFAEEEDDIMLDRHEDDEIDSGSIALNESPTVAMFNRVRTPRRFVGAQRHPKLSEQKRLIIAFQTYMPRLGALSTEGTANPHLRVHHFFQKNRTFAFGTAYITSAKEPQAFLAAMYQYHTSPRKAVCVTFSLERTNTPINSGPTNSSQMEHYKLFTTCTCSQLVRQTKGCDDACYHAQVCFANQDRMTFASSEIRIRQEVAHLDGSNDTIFGRCIDVDRLGDLWFFLIAFLERKMQRGRKLTRPWMFFLVLDVNMQLFVPIMKQYGKLFLCMLCRGAADQRLACDHGDSCHAAYLKVREDPRGHGLLSQLAIFDYDSSDSESEDENNRS